MGDAPDDRLIRSYLLGEMSAEERAAFQQRPFEDDEVFLRVLAAEDDMADALAKGELPQDEAARVRTFLEESSQRDRLMFAQAFARMESAPKRGSSLWVWRALPLAACIVLSAISLWLAVRNRELQTPIAGLRPATETSGAIFAARIPAGRLRGSGTRPALEIPADTRIVELRLEVRSPGSFQRYRFDVNRASGQAIISIVVPGPLAAETVVAVPRTNLAPGDYELALSGLQGDQAKPIDDNYYAVR
jgi:hypothetical protein